MAGLFPNALISHRTALTFQPTNEGDVFLTSTSNRTVEYPGLRLRFVRGPEALPDDPKFMTLHSSSLPRAFLENLTTTHPSSRSRVLSQTEIEERLETILHANGAAELQSIRVRAREIARQFHWDKAIARLESIIGALLQTRHHPLASEVGRSRAIGEPFDPACVERLQILFGELRSPLPVLIDQFAAPDHPRNKAFFEAYFSNYIEGTVFEIEEAEQIVFDHQIPQARPRDAHDIQGTFDVVSNTIGMRQTARNFGEFVELMQLRHRAFIGQRPEAYPGQFKTRPNRAGDTHFVHPDYLVGTLRKGFELYTSVTAGIARAIFMMFLVSDVHPFVDGNGRLARIMMNSELVACGHSTIIVPTVFRDDYLNALRALLRRHRPAPIVQALARAQRFSHREFSPYPTVLADLQRRNWFREPDEARIVE